MEPPHDVIHERSFLHSYTALDGGYSRSSNVKSGEDLVHFVIRCGPCVHCLSQAKGLALLEHSRRQILGTSRCYFVTVMFDS